MNSPDIPRLLQSPRPYHDTKPTQDGNRDILPPSRPSAGGTTVLALRLKRFAHDSRQRGHEVWEAWPDIDWPISLILQEACWARRRPTRVSLAWRLLTFSWCLSWSLGRLCGDRDPCAWNDVLPSCRAEDGSRQWTRQSSRLQAGERWQVFLMPRRLCSLGQFRDGDMTFTHL